MPTTTSSLRRCRVPAVGRSWRRAVLAALVLAVPVLVLAAPSAPAAAVSGTYSNPLTGDAPDPDIVLVNGTYYAFTTGNPVERIEEFQSTDLAHWGQVAFPGALTNDPPWAFAGEEWAPSVAEIGGQWVMYYATFDITTETHCISVATSANVAGPYVDNSAGPLVCQSGYGGDLDPDYFVDANGTPYLVWKSQPGLYAPEAQLWSEPLAANGLSFVPETSPTPILDQNQAWESTIENPNMVLVGNEYYLFYSGGNWMDSSYAIGYAVCQSPLGPCAKPYDHPIFHSTAQVVGPGGDWAFGDATGQWWMAYAAWTGGNVGYPGGARSMRLDPLCFSSGHQGGIANPVVSGPTTGPEPLQQTCPATDDVGQYRLVAADGGIFAFGGAPYFGSKGGQFLLFLRIVDAATDPATEGYWEVASNGAVYGFNAPFLGDASRDVQPGQPIVAMTATPDGGGYWLVSDTGAVYAFGDAPYVGSMAGQPLASPIVGMAATPDGKGYWLVAADGGIFAFGDAPYLGSMGGQPLNRPIVGMAAMPDGKGYWLVAADGGIFAYGDAPFRGSTGSLTLNQPIVGMLPEGAGGGYWLVAADGGIFAFGSAPYEGSTGGLPLIAPVVAVNPG
ncbi:MAG TPA: glycoside hydrolase family 43 protein [Acidimicrobiales bacterium]|nr:glycoside hydrolase family 43 protein [Acidimicrobiales bacterium]